MCRPTHDILPTNEIRHGLTVPYGIVDEMGNLNKTIPSIARVLPNSCMPLLELWSEAVLMRHGQSNTNKLLRARLHITSGLELFML